MAAMGTLFPQISIVCSGLLLNGAREELGAIN